MKTNILVIAIAAFWLFVALWSPLGAVDYARPKTVKKYKFQGGYIFDIQLDDGKKTRCVVTKLSYGSGIDCDFR